MMPQPTPEALHLHHTRCCLATIPSEASLEPPRTRCLLGPESLCAQSWLCACGEQHSIPTRRVVIEEDAVEQVPELLVELCGSGDVLIVMDATTREVLGQRVESQLSASGKQVAAVVFGADVEADTESVDRAVSRVGDDTGVLLSVGAGTINDITKMAAHLTGRKYISVATAPSQNGFASPIAALLENGIKTTQPANPPVAVMGDVKILSHAPLPMIRSGFADLLGRPTANADWLLAHLVKGERYCSQPFEIVAEAENACRDCAGSIGRAEPAAVGTLMAALVLSSFSMVVGGSSAPASGGEHLISHYMDSKPEWRRGRPLEQRLHGLQVGVATLLMARLYQRLFELSPEDIALDRLERGYPRWEAEEATIRCHYAAAADAAVSQFRLKYQPWEDKRAELKEVVTRWDEIRAALRQIVPQSDALAETLHSAGAPITSDELGLSATQMREALLHARYLRSRYTVLDLAADLGVLSPLGSTVGSPP